MYIFIIEMQKKVIMCLKMWKRPSLLCWVHVLEENLLYTLSRVEGRNSILVPVFPLLQKKKPLELPFLKAFYSHYWEKLFWRNYIISIMNSTRYKYWCMGRQKKKEGQKTHNDSWNYFGNRTLLTLLWLGTFSNAKTHLWWC